MSESFNPNSFDALLDEYLNDKLLAVRRIIQPEANRIIEKAIREIDALCPDLKRDKKSSWLLTQYDAALAAYVVSLSDIAKAVPSQQCAALTKIVKEIETMRKGGAS